MQLPYEYSYFAFDFRLIKKMCVRKQKSERVEGESKETSVWEREWERREGGRNMSKRGLGEISSLVDEWEWAMRLTERCKHLHTLRQPWSMEPTPVAWRIRRAGEKGPEKIGPARRHFSPALIKRWSRVQSDKTVATSWLLNKADMFCMEKLHPEPEKVQ